MSDPIIKEATKKAFHFPKSSRASSTESKKKAAAPADVKATKKAATKPEAKAETKPEAKAETKAATKTKSAAKTPAQKKAPKVEAAATPRTRPIKATEDVKAKRAKKDKVIRDSFTMPKSDYDKIAALKAKCQEAGVSIKKSELLRAGLLMLEAAAPKRLLAAVSAVEQVKTGRPSKS